MTEDVLQDVVAMIEKLQQDKKYESYLLPVPLIGSTDRRYIRRRARRCGVKFATFNSSPRFYMLMMGTQSEEYKQSLKRRLPNSLARKTQ